MSVEKSSVLLATLLRPGDLRSSLSTSVSSWFCSTGSAPQLCSIGVHSVPYGHAAPWSSAQMYTDRVFDHRTKKKLLASVHRLELLEVMDSEILGDLCLVVNNSLFCKPPWNIIFSCKGSSSLECGSAVEKTCRSTIHCPLSSVSSVSGMFSLEAPVPW